jgi:uroporphyrinogen III methyltransferase / synthase
MDSQVGRPPLSGRRVIVTRALPPGHAFSRRLRSLGAEIVEFPTIQTAPPDDYAPLDRSIERLSSFDWVIFTSATGVESFMARVKALGRDVRAIGAARLAAIGPATRAALERYGLQVDVMPAEYRAEAIAEAIGDSQIRGAAFLIARAQVSREALPELLRRKGAREVEVVAAYQTVIPPSAAARIDELHGIVNERKLDLVAFSSSSTVTNLCALLGGVPAGLKAAAIGPITAATARARGFDVVVSAKLYTLESLAEAICDYLLSKPSL